MSRPMYEEFQVRSLRDFLENLPSDREKFPWGYRGHAKDTWKLIPTLFRQFTNGTSDINTATVYRNLEQLLLMKFKAYARPHISFEPNTDLAWLALAQHHGMPTRLLDWTENPLVALFFALMEKTETNAVVWACLAMRGLVENKRTLDALDKDMLKGQANHEYLEAQDLNQVLYRYHPSHTTNRITTQQGFFTVQPLWSDVFGVQSLLPLEEQFAFDLYPFSSGMDDPSGPWFKKYIIAQENRDSIWQNLHTIGINYYSIFPDLEGIARKLREDVEMEKRF